MAVSTPRHADGIRGWGCTRSEFPGQARPRSLILRRVQACYWWTASMGVLACCYVASSTALKSENKRPRAAPQHSVNPFTICLAVNCKRTENTATHFIYIILNIYFILNGYIILLLQYSKCIIFVLKIACFIGHGTHNNKVMIGFVQEQRLHLQHITMKTTWHTQKIIRIVPY
jgi:hypothetical protein